MDNVGYCPVCGREATVSSPVVCIGLFVKCEHCRIFIVEETAQLILESEEGYKFRNALYFYLTHKRENTNRIPKIIDAQKSFEDKAFDVILVSEIMQYAPKNINQRIDFILQNLFKIESRVGCEIVVSRLSREHNPIFLIEENHSVVWNNQFRSICEMLKQMELISFEEISLVPSRDYIFKIEYKGWERIDRLKSSLESHSQGFIAMWFNPKMNEYREAIKSAIIKAGYRPMIIDEKPHNNQIVPELLYEIRQSDFLVADLTGNRNGVYYEAGYALGLGKQVIFTVEEEELEDTMEKQDEQNDKEEKNRPHFDVAQVSQVRYKTSHDLEEKLYARIISTIGEGKNKIQ